MVGSKLGPYDILEEVGRGGMATVYRAYHPQTDRIVAVKVIRTSFLDDPDCMARFQREARVIAKLEHPHLLPVYDFDGAHAPPYIVMRFLDGATLKDHMHSGRLPLEVAVHIIAQVASALDFAHRQGVVHRDIKPSNIMIDTDGNAFLADFGLARIDYPDRPGEVGLTLPGTVLGTPSYMAPEQVMGAGGVDHRADLYSLGVILFELATGHLPFEGEHPIAVAMAHVNRPVPRATTMDPGLPEALDAVLEKAMAKAPENRFASGSALAQAAAVAAGLTGSGFTATGSFADARLRSALSGTPPRPEEPPAGERAKSDSHATPSERRKLVTVLSANLSALAEFLAEEDPESASGALDRLWGHLEEVVGRSGGRMERRSADAALVLWGVEASQEDDPERAVTCALEMQAALKEFLGPNHGGRLPLQVGITTGHVHLSQDKPSGRVAASGASLFLASRMERAAPPGSILISKETRHHVKEAFELAPGPPLEVLDQKAPQETYLVTGARAAGTAPAGETVSGGTTFRKAELAVLQGAFLAAGRESRSRVVTVIAQPGLGKGRLLSDFDLWLERERLPYARMGGRATVETIRQPYALLRAAFAHHLGLHPGDGPEVVRRKATLALAARAGATAGADSAETVQFFARWLGGAEGESAAASTLSRGGERFRETLVHHAVRYCAAATRRAVLVLEFTDLHWADEGSLAALQEILRESARLPLVALCFARPDLFDRVPTWGEGFSGYARVNLDPLSRQEGAALVGELLRAVPHVPDELRDLIVERAEGNPLYMEELVQALIDDGVVIPGESQWRVDMSRLTTLRVPTTLTGLLQARLEGLHPAERTALQRAAVIGRFFWAEGVTALGAADGATLDPEWALKSLAQRALVEERPTSSLPGVQEYAFASNILRDVVLEGIPGRMQRAYSGHAARWLALNFGARSIESAAAIGEHFERADETGEAARYLARAGEQALEVSAYEDARGFLKRALGLLKSGGGTESQEASVRIHLAEALSRLGRYGAAREHLEEALAAAASSGEARLRADALYNLAQVAISEGDLGSARRRFEESLEAAQVEDRWAQARALFGLGDVAWRAGATDEAQGHLEAALMLARETGDPTQELDCLHRLGSVALSSGRLEPARSNLEECRTKALESGSRDRLASALDGLGEVLLRQGDSSGARDCFQQALALSEALGLHMAAVHAKTDLAFAELDLGESERARDHFAQALREAQACGEAEGILRAAMGFAALIGGEEGISLVREVLRHPAAAAAVQECARPVSGAGGVNAQAPPAADAPPPPDLDDLVRRLLRHVSE